MYNVTVIFTTNRKEDNSRDSMLEENVMIDHVVFNNIVKSILIACIIAKVPYRPV